MIGKLRFIVLQTILAAALAALWFNGSLELLIHGGSVYPLIGLILMSLFGLWCVLTRRTDDAYFTVTTLVKIGLAGMMFSFAAGIGAFVQVAINGSMKDAMLGILPHIAAAMVISASSIVSGVWIEISERFSRG